MFKDYVSYLESLNNHLKREGITLPVDLSCDSFHILAQAVVLEQFLYFNDILKIVDSQHKIKSLLDINELDLDSFIRKMVFQKYMVVWNQRLEDLVKQPEDAGVISAPITRLSKKEVRLFHESLNLITQTEKLEEETEGVSDPDWVFDDDEEDEYSEEEDFSEDDEDQLIMSSGVNFDSDEADNYESDGYEYDDDEDE